MLYILFFCYRTPAFNVPTKFPTTPCIDIDFNEFCMSATQENRESRGSVSYTDYYSNEDGQIRRPGHSGFGNSLQRFLCTDDFAMDSMDDEDHTLTLKQTEEQKKQDIKLIFHQQEATKPVKGTNSYKKIGRFRVESMDISDEDVRIKEKDNPPLSAPADRGKKSMSKFDQFNLDKAVGESLEPRRANSLKNFRATFSRSQSMTAPKTGISKQEISCKRTPNPELLSSVSQNDLENVNFNLLGKTASSFDALPTEEPVLTLASTIDSPSVVRGFDVQDENNQ